MFAKSVEEKLSTGMKPILISCFRAAIRNVVEGVRSTWASLH